MKEGSKIPAFSLMDQSGKEKKFADLAGKAGLVLYVYPKDNTSGCSLEAQEFKTLAPEFKKKGFAVAGISKDSVKSHCGFAEKYDLDFPLLSDPELKLISALGAYGEKKMYGKPVMGTIRSTFIFDAKGKLLKAYSGVKAAGHAAAVLEDTGALK